MESSQNIDTVNKKVKSTSTSKKGSTCKFCHEKFMRKEDMWKHVRVHYEKDKMLSCEFCDFVTDAKQHLEYHLRTHTGEKPYKCDHCSYVCANKTMLNVHMKKHENFYQFSCQDCSYKCKHRHSFRNHLRKYSHKGLEFHKNSGEVSEFDPDAAIRLGRTPGQVQNRLSSIEMETNRIATLVANPVTSMVSTKNESVQKDKSSKPVEENASSELCYLDKDKLRELLTPEIVWKELTEDDPEFFIVNV